jgi:hypothetical protein
MRMFRLPSWISESRGCCEKAVNGEPDRKMADAAPPVVDILPRGAPKRKWTVSEDDQESIEEGAHDAKRRRPDLLREGSLEIASREEISIEEKTETVVDPSRVRETIESQFSLEILLKHDELRLINQELAKCQVALEQLRRCHLIPYPNSQGTSDSMLNISCGIGHALRRSDSVPQWAAPYGVADGPYSRHYAKWLIPHPSFDGAQDEWDRSSEMSRAGKTIPEGRSTRHSFAEGSTVANKARSHRGSTGQKLHALSSGYPQARGKAGPCILKRAVDNQMVKLVCNSCDREDFSSTQGFINHCRIAHHKEYKSHEEAAVACGQPIEIDDDGGIVGEDKGSTAAAGLVHPLIRSASTDREAYAALLSRINASRNLFEQGRLPGVTSIPTSANQTPSKGNGPKLGAETGWSKDFVPSSDTPHFSNFMRNRGFAGNLTEMVDEAKMYVELDDSSSPDEESDDGERNSEEFRMAERGAAAVRMHQNDGAGSPQPHMRPSVRAAMSPAPLGRPGSSKGIDAKNGRKPGISPRISYATPVISTAAAASNSRPSVLLTNNHAHDFDHDIDVDLSMMGPSLVDLSPNTVASNNAPSLVSDDGEYDEGDDDAESASCEDEDEGSDVAEIDIEDGELEKMVPRTVLRNRSGTVRKEDRHVTFVSPVKERRNRK